MKLVYSILAISALPAPAALAAPRVVKASCLALFTAGKTSGSVPILELSLARGESRTVYEEGGLKFVVSYGAALALPNVLQFSATGPTAAEGAAVSLAIDKELPARFDLSVNSGFLSCGTR